MRSRSVFLFTIVAIIIIAFFTKPGKEKFQEFIRDKSALPPGISQTNALIYNVYTVTYYDTKNIPQPSTGDKKIAIEKEKAVYLGLFGRFWKI